MGGEEEKGNGHQGLSVARRVRISISVRVFARVVQTSKIEQGKCQFLQCNIEMRSSVQQIAHDATSKRTKSSVQPLSAQAERKSLR